MTFLQLSSSLQSRRLQPSGTFPKRQQFQTDDRERNNCMAITLSLGLLLLRLVAGLTLAVHGAQRFGWFGGFGFTKAAQGMQKQGFNPAWFWTSLMILGEFGGGLSLAFGFLTPLGAAGAIDAMFMPLVKVHRKHGFWTRRHGLKFHLQF